MISGESDSEGIGSHCFSSTKFACNERFLGRGRGYFDRSEEEEIEAYASSMDSSMRVYYPRHLMRVR
jgi:hypothetical protein